MNLNLPFGRKLSSWESENLDSTLGYLDPSLRSFKISATADSIDLVFSCAVDREKIRGKLNMLLDRVRPRYEEAEVEMRFDNASVSVPYSDDAFSALKAEKKIYSYGEGVFALGPRLTRLVKALDAVFEDFARSQGAEEVYCPVTIPLETLKECGVFSQYPHLLNFMCQACQDVERIPGLLRAGESKKPADMLGFFEAPVNVFRSTGCMHVYPMFRDSTLGSHGTCITNCGPMFRNESIRVQSFERLNEFTMREVIYIGSRESVSERLEQAMVWMQDFMVKAGLKGKLASARDPFFATEMEALQAYQAANGFKFEAKLHIPFTGHDISAASFNNHSTHFAKAFHIQLEGGSFAHTGCVGFGYERILFSILSQYGTEESRWPGSLKNLLKLA
jgi:seryl-tRNA synthetase